MTEAAETPLAAPVHPDATGARIGMWLFLFTEILLFGGLFLLYAVYRSKFPGDFHFCAAELDTFMGTINTLILLTSSMTMVLAVTALGKKNRKMTSIFLSATIFLAVVFLINRYFEWSAKFTHGLYPNSDILEYHTAGENIFYGLYYLMTGLHGLHILIGIVILAVMLFMVSKKSMKGIKAEVEWEGLHIKIENSGLFWHLVNIIWIFLFPLLYLIS
jgi:cytochrome c oxidase subunit 3